MQFYGIFHAKFIILFILLIILYCNISFGAESFIFQVAIQKFKDQDI